FTKEQRVRQPLTLRHHQRHVTGGLMRRVFNVLTALLACALVAPLAAQSDVNGTWTAELRQGKVFLQVRTEPPDSSRSGDGRGWNMGQSYPVEELSGLPANDEH